MERKDDAARLSGPMRAATAAAAIDLLVAGTVNASVRATTDANELARWIRFEDTRDPRAISALDAFFHDVPLGTQVAFLAYHRLDEACAVAFAVRLEAMDRDIPLASRSRW